MPKIKAIITYPVKSCGGVSWFQAYAIKRGLSTDREFLVVDKNWRMMTQREYPTMCLIDIYTRPTVGHASLGFPGAGRIFLPLFAQKKNYDEVVVSIWDDKVRAYDQGGLLADWFTARLRTECRLVRMADEEVRKTRHGEGEVGFADGYPVLGISEASLDDLNARMKASSVSMDRFRPNIVFRGCEPFEEDTWRRIRIGDVELVGETLCARCEVPTTNQKTAERGKEPSATLSKFRRVKHIVAPAWKLPYLSRVYFGRNFNISTFGRIDTNMEVEVIERD